MHDLAVDEVVGDVEQAVDEHAIAGDAFGEHGIALAGRRRALDEEAALRADRHDDRVLDHLRLDQAQHFGAEILAAIRPAQAAARDRAEAQVHAFDARRRRRRSRDTAAAWAGRAPCDESNLKLM